MKNIVRQLVGISLFQSILFAGGIITPSAVTETPNAETKYNFYFGLGRSDMQLENSLTKEDFTAKGVTLQLGYNYNRYLSIEGRYTHHVGRVHYNHGSNHQTNAGINISDYPTDFTNIALYLKPTYSIDDLTVYALLGYGEVKLTNIPIGSTDRAEDGFQWGLGVSYNLQDNWSVYFDYLNMYEGKGFDYRAQKADIKADAWTIGLSYKF